MTSVLRTNSCRNEQLVRKRRLASLLIEDFQMVYDCNSPSMRSGKRFGLLDIDDMWHTMRYDSSTASLIDDEDYSRVAYFVRRYRGPACLAALGKDGLVDDFFGAWSPIDDTIDAGDFNADREWDLLLDVW